MHFSTETLYEVGAENRALSNSSFSASGFSSWVTGRYLPHDGRLNNDRPWEIDKAREPNPWFKVDLGRVMLVNGISTQGDNYYAPNYYPDYKLKYSLDANPTTGSLIYVKEETSAAVRV